MIPLLQWHSNNYYILWVCVCSLWYQTCNTHAPYYIVICGLPCCTIFFQIVAKKAWFSEKNLLNIKLCFDLPYNVCPKHFLLYEEMSEILSYMCICIHVKYPFFYVYWIVHHCNNWRIRNQLDTTVYFIVLLICSICFGHYYAHHQELATMMLITTLVVSFLVCCRLEVRCG